MKLKRTLGIFLALSMVFSMVTATFANTPQARFLAAFEATNAQLQYENELIAASDDSVEIMEQLFQNVFQMYMQFSMTESESQETVSMEDIFKMDAPGKKILNEFNMQVDESIDFDLNLYLSEDKLSINIPQLYDSYISVDPTDLDAWNNSAIGQELPIGTNILSSISYDALIGDGEGYDLQIADRIVEKYTQAFMDLAAKGNFIYNGQDEVLSRTSRIATEKYSVVIDKDDMNAFFKTLSQMIANDQDLYQLLDSIYAPLNFLYPGGSLAQEVLNIYAELFEMLECSDDFTYTIFVNENGLIVRHECWMYLTDYFDDEMLFVVQYDNKGAFYLTDEIALTIDMYIDGEKVTVAMDSYGDTVPRNGYTDNRTTLSVSYDDVNLDIFSLDYAWNANASSDNFEMTMMLDLMPGYSSDGKMTFVAKGDLAVSKEDRTVIVNLKDCVYEMMGTTVSGNILVEFSPVSASEIEIPANQEVVLTELTEQQILNIVDEILENMEELGF